MEPIVTGIDFSAFDLMMDLLDAVGLELVKGSNASEGIVVKSCTHSEFEHDIAGMLDLQQQMTPNFYKKFWEILDAYKAFLADKAAYYRLAYLTGNALDSTVSDAVAGELESLEDRLPAR